MVRTEFTLSWRAAVATVAGVGKSASTLGDADRADEADEADGVDEADGFVAVMTPTVLGHGVAANYL